MIDKLDYHSKKDIIENSNVTENAVKNSYAGKSEKKHADCTKKEREKNVKHYLEELNGR